MRKRSCTEGGQAAVEAALTMPLAVFLILGTLQLFLMLQARLMAEHAVFRAVRSGSLSQGSCTRMMHTALLTLMPTFARTDEGPLLVDGFARRKNNRYDPALDSKHDGEIVWLLRESPRRTDLPAGRDDANFDDVDRGDPRRLEVRLIFWYPLRIPFANWVIARMALASWGLLEYRGGNPLMPTRDAQWTPDGPPAGVPAAVLSQLVARTDNPQGTFVFPIQATAAMRMMTPARRAFFAEQHCR